MNQKEILEALAQAADSLDPVAVNDFFIAAIETNLNYLELVRENLSLVETMKRVNANLAGSILLGMFNHFAAQKFKDGLK